MTGHGLEAEYSNVVAASGMQLPPECLVDAVRFAAQAAFVSGEEKRSLLGLVEERLRVAEGLFVEDDAVAAAAAAADATGAGVGSGVAAASLASSAVVGESRSDSESGIEVSMSLEADSDDGFEHVEAPNDFVSTSDKTCRII